MTQTTARREENRTLVDETKDGKAEPAGENAAEESVALLAYPATEDSVIGKTIGSYLVMEELGSGGMAVVYKARHLTLDRIVAIKEIQRNFCQDPRFLKRFQSEAKTAARIQHPNIVTLYEYLNLDSRHFLVLEYVSGGTVSDIWEDRPMPLTEARRMFEHLLNGLEAVHSEQIV